MATSFVRPEPPYYAVIITTRPAADLDGYAAMGARMAELGEAQPGYLGRESLTDADGRDLTVLYYADAASIAAWKAHPEHLEAQRLGRERWYSSYRVEVARVERAYAFGRDAAEDGAAAVG
ncbi:antibiotic biosynthesis monooxygenase family protein [Streptomyces seoulensis]